MATREDELSALRATFFEEADERLSEVEGLLLELEQRPEDMELIAPIFRAIHSLKSGGAACELSDLANFAHVFENLLDQLRKGNMRARPSTLNVLLASTDMMVLLLRAARGAIASIAMNEVERVTTCIQTELTGAGIASTPPPAAHLVSDDGLEGLVLWDDEPVEPSAEPPAEQAPSSLPLESAPALEQEVYAEPTHSEDHREATHEAPGDADGEPEPQREEALEGEGAESEPPPEDGALLSSQQLSRLVDLSVELVVASSALSHALSDPHALALDRVRGLFTEAQAHANEIESRLAEVRSDQSSIISEVVYLVVGKASYFVPLANVERYFSPAPGALRKLPLLGEVLESDGLALPTYRLHALMGCAGCDTSAVAVVLHTRRGKTALLVDEVRTQMRVVVRPLEHGLGERSGLLGAALYAGSVVLVLDPEALVAPRPKRTRDYSIQIL